MRGVEKFDGLNVDLFQARLVGPIEVDPTDARRMAIDDEFLMVVAVRSKGAAIAGTGAGDIKLTRSLSVKGGAMVRSPELSEMLYDTFGLERPVPTLELEWTSSASATSVAEEEPSTPASDEPEALEPEPAQDEPSDSEAVLVATGAATRDGKLRDFMFGDGNG